MKTSSQKPRMLVGALLIAAALGVGAGSEELAPPAADAPRGDEPMLPVMDAAPIVKEPAEPAATPVESEPNRAAEPIRPEPAPAAVSPLLVMEGTASWYADALAGRRTASGAPYVPAELIAAHRALPFGTRLRVTNLANDRSVEVRVIDRGPFVAGRVLDLSRAAAERIGIIRAGHGRVRIEVLEYGA